MLKRIKNHSKVRSAGLQDSLALPLLSVMPHLRFRCGPSCPVDLPLYRWKLLCCVCPAHQAHCLFVKEATVFGMALCCKGRPDSEQAVCAPLQVQIAFCLQQGTHSTVDCAEAADRRLSGLDWLLLCAAAGQPSSPSDKVNWRTPGRTDMRCFSSATTLYCNRQSGGPERPVVPVQRRGGRKAIQVIGVTHIPLSRIPVDPAAEKTDEPVQEAPAQVCAALCLLGWLGL